MKYFQSKGVYLIIFVVLVVWYRADGVISDPFRSSHNWRKTDGLSFSLNYYDHGMHFFKPQMHGLISEGGTSGYTTGEFPLLYYINAVLWKVFGKDEIVNGVFGLLILFIALYFMYDTLQQMIKDKKLVVLFMLLFTSSPLLWIYAPLPLTNMPAVLLVIIGWNFFFRYYKRHNQLHLVICVMLFSLATLLKASEFISFAALGLLFLIELLGKQKTEVFKKKGQVAIIMAIGVALPLLWYLYAIWYNNYYGGHLTSNSIAPIWEVESSKVGGYWTSLRDHIVPTFYHRSMMYLFLVVVLYNLASYRKSWKAIYILKTALLVFSITYFILWFKAMDVNHYYFITFFVWVFLEFLYFMLIVKDRLARLLKNAGFVTATCVFVLLNMAYGKTIVEMSYIRARGVHILSPNSEYEGIMKYYEGEYENETRYMLQMEGYLDTLGVSDTARVISLPDITFNKSLYMMNRKGWTDYQRNEGESYSQYINDKIQKGASILVISDNEVYEDSTISPFLNFPLGEIGPIKVYRLTE